MKVTAGILSVVFAGSYISCVVQNEISDYQKKTSAEVSETAVTTVITEPEITTPAVSEEVTSSVTTVPVTTVTTTIETTAETTTEPEEEITEETTVTVTEPVTTVTTVPVTEAPKYNYGAPVPAAAAKDSSYYDKCAFIGDSHIKGMSGYGLVADGRVFAQNGMSITHINDYISVDKVSASGAENVYIMMGTNGVMWIDWKVMISQYEEFVDKVTAAMPSSNIYILSIPPVTAERETRADVASGKYLNSDIDLFNKELLKMAEKNQWYFVDVNTALKNENGCLGSSTDGVHMTKDLYEVFGNYILNHTVN